MIDTAAAGLGYSPRAGAGYPPVDAVLPAVGVALVVAQVEQLEFEFPAERDDGRARVVRVDPLLDLQ